MSLQKAIDKAKPGSTIILVPDTDRTPIRIKTSGKEGKPITIQAWRSVVSMGHSADSLRFGFAVPA